MRALQHYTDIVDIKRVLINTHAIDPQVWTEVWDGRAYLRKPSAIRITVMPLFISTPIDPLFTAIYTPQALVEYFGTLSKEWALDCLKELLVVNPQVRGSASKGGAGQWGRCRSRGRRRGRGGLVGIAYVINLPPEAFPSG